MLFMISILEKQSHGTSSGLTNWQHFQILVTESANIHKRNLGETEYFSCQCCFLILSWGVTGNTKGWQENLQCPAPFDTGIASYVPYSAKLLCTTSSFFIRCLWGQPRPVPSSAPAAYQLFWWMTVSEHSDHIELELLLRPFSVGLSSNALPLYLVRGCALKPRRDLSIGLITSSELIIFKAWWLC